MKYFIIAGERSGDLHGGNLVKEIKRLDDQAILFGVGGSYMEQAGASLIAHYDELAVMGFTALLTSFPKIARYLHLCKKEIAGFSPDVVILIDYGGFNLRMARFCRENHFKVFYYIPPKIWAWNQGRVRILRENVNRIFSILPFEKAFYHKHDVEIDYVGNPVLDAVKAYQRDDGFMSKYNLDANKKIVALLPGSRKMELKRMVPVMARVVERNPEYQFVVAAVRGMPEELYEPLHQLPSVTFVYDSTYDILSHAHTAIVTSGTATLETSLFGVPQVVIYSAGSVEYPLLKRLVKVRFISLVNLIADKSVIRELIQDEMTVENITAELKEISEDGPYRRNMLDEYKAIYSTLDTGSASVNAANLMIKYLKEEVPG